MKFIQLFALNANIFLFIKQCNFIVKKRKTIQAVTYASSYLLLFPITLKIGAFNVFRLWRYFPSCRPCVIYVYTVPIYNTVIQQSFFFRLARQAGVYLLATNGQIPPLSIEHMETSCPLYETGKVIHPFAYRVHTHELGMCSQHIVYICRYLRPNIECRSFRFVSHIGKVVAGYRVRTSRNGVQKWDLLGKRDPLTPQMFYPIENNVTVESGDILVSSRYL